MKKSVRSVISLLMSVVLLVCFSLSSVCAADEKEDKKVIIACSDFQPNSEYIGSLYVGYVLDQIKSAGITEIDGFLACGDYTLSMNNANASTSGAATLKSAVTGKFDIAEENMVLIHGNHDPIGAVGLSESGNNDPADGGYGVFAINEDDYMWQQGKTTTNGNASVSDDAQTVQKTAANLKAYLDEKISQKFMAPIFVISHLPLHFSTRTAEGDCQYAKYLFDVMNDASAAGLNIIYLFGHDHGRNHDDYLGGSAVCLKPGDNIYIANAGSTTEYTKQTLGFTYMNAGYTGYYNSSNNPAPDTTLTMTVYEIYEDRVNISRYSSKGLHNLKSSGVGSVGEIPANTDVYASPANIVLQFFREKGNLSNDRRFDAMDLLMLQQHILSRGTLSDDLVYYADMNDDNVVDITDLTILQMLILGTVK